MGHCPEGVHRAGARGKTMRVRCIDPGGEVSGAYENFPALGKFRYKAAYPVIPLSRPAVYVGGNDHLG